MSDYGTLLRDNPQCANCGARFKLHESGTLRCPKNGQEAGPAVRQEWQDTKYSELIVKIINDAPAPAQSQSCDGDGCGNSYEGHYVDTPGSPCIDCRDGSNRREAPAQSREEALAIERLAMQIALGPKLDEGDGGFAWIKRLLYNNLHSRQSPQAGDMNGVGAQNADDLLSLLTCAADAGSGIRLDYEEIEILLGSWPEAARPAWMRAEIVRLRAHLAASDKDEGKMRDLVESALGTIEATTLGDNGWWRSWIIEARAALERKEGE
jgi:hypothetical protein